MAARLLAHSALIGRAGEMFVSAELMRRGIEVAQPQADIGVDLLAYLLPTGATAPTRVAPIQVKSASGVAFRFQKTWLQKAANLVIVWRLAPGGEETSSPECYVFSSQRQVEDALGQFAASKSWTEGGIYSVTAPGPLVLARMKPHRDRWDRIADQLSNASG